MNQIPQNNEAAVTLKLPPAVAKLVRARQALRDHYGTVHGDRLQFTFDGNLVGDIGEALAVEYYGMTLDRRGGEAVDGIAPDGTTVQVKTTGTGRGAVFRNTVSHAHRLLFLCIDFSTCTAAVVYNGLEAPVRLKLGPSWSGQRAVSMTQMRALDRDVPPEERLTRTLAA